MYYFSGPAYDAKPSGIIAADLVVFRIAIGEYDIIDAAILIHDQAVVHLVQGPKQFVQLGRRRGFKGDSGPFGGN